MAVNRIAVIVASEADARRAADVGAYAEAGAAAREAHQL